MYKSTIQKWGSTPQKIITFTSNVEWVDNGHVIHVPKDSDENYDVVLCDDGNNQCYWYNCNVLPLEEGNPNNKGCVIIYFLSDGIIVDDTTYITIYTVMGLTTLPFILTDKYRLKFNIPQLVEKETFPDGWIPQDTFELYFEGKVFYNDGMYEQYHTGHIAFTYDPVTGTRSDQTNGNFSVEGKEIIAVYDERQEILYVEYD